MSRNSKTTFFSYFDDENLLTIAEKGKIPAVLSQIGPHIDKIEKEDLTEFLILSL